jgi:DNA-binding GntR family transcriptional regulator
LAASLGPSAAIVGEAPRRSPDEAVPIRRRPLHDEATERLRDMIVEGRLAAGDWINELELCKQLQISRTPLREALKVLASEGLVELVPRRGARVALLSAREIVDLFEALSALEGIAAELAAARMSGADIDKLRALQARIEQHHRAKNRLDYFRDNQTLHEAIVASAGNSAIAEIHLRLIARVGNARYVAILSETRWSDAVQEHAEILAALERRDARRAGELMRQHVARTGEVVRASLDRDHGDREANMFELAAMANANL